MLTEAEQMDDIEIIGAAGPMNFDAHGNLIPDL
jgi:hypothetical protein